MKKLLIFSAALAFLICGIMQNQAHAYGDVRRVGFRLNAPHGPYKAELFKPGDGMPTRVVTDIYPAFGWINVTFNYTVTDTDYFIRVTDNGGHQIQPPSFRLYGNTPGWYDNVYGAGTIAFPW